MAKLISTKKDTPSYKAGDRVTFHTYTTERGGSYTSVIKYAIVEKVNRVTARVATADGSKWSLDLSELTPYVDPYKGWSLF